MPYKEKTDTLDRKYWSIGEVAELLDFRATSQLRFYETEKVLRKRPKKNRRGFRKYDKHDISILRKIKLAEESGEFTLHGITTAAYDPERILEIIYQMHPHLNVNPPSEIHPPKSEIA